MSVGHSRRLYALPPRRPSMHGNPKLGYRSRPYLPAQSPPGQIVETTPLPARAGTQLRPASDAAPETPAGPRADVTSRDLEGERRALPGPAPRQHIGAGSCACICRRGDARLLGRHNFREGLGDLERLWIGPRPRYVALTYRSRTTLLDRCTKQGKVADPATGAPDLRCNSRVLPNRPYLLSPGTSILRKNGRVQLSHVKLVPGTGLGTHSAPLAHQPDLAGTKNRKPARQQ